MGLIPDDKIAEIRDRTDIVQVVGEYVSLKRSGVNHKGLCPFHQEKSPSFNVNSAKQFFHCFGCGKSGDVYTFLTEIEGKSFVDVARELARRSGVEVPEAQQSRAEAKAARDSESERARMVRLHELAAGFFRAQLDAPVGDGARAYLEKRGIGSATQEKFRVGYAPPGWDALTRFFESKKVPHELAERAGLIRRRQKDDVPAAVTAGAPPSKTTHFDVFVDRVVYALTSPVGEVIGFGGRVLDGAAAGDQPKYKNSPETLIYKKGENLFGLHLAKHAIRRRGRALVVEGNFDVMTLHERGVDYAVAPQGTAITDAQVQLLGRFAQEVVLMLDADPAGRAATLKVIHRFADAEVKARVAQLRSANGRKVDPDDLARNDLPRLEAMIDSAADAVEFFFEQVAATSEPTVPGKVAALEECAPLLRSIRDSVARDLYLERLATLLKVDAGLVRRAMRGSPTASAPRQTPAPAAATSPDAVVRRALEPRVAKLLAFLGQHATLIARMSPELLAQIADADVRTLLIRAIERQSFSPAEALSTCSPEIRDAVARALASEEFATEDEASKLRALDEILGKMKLPLDRPRLEEERKHALERGDLEAVQVLNVRIRKALQGESSR